MKLKIKGKNTAITDALQSYVEKRFSKLEKYFTNELEGTVTLIIEREDHIAEATIPINRFILRAEESSHDMYTSIDNIVEKLERQVRKYKTRVNRKSKEPSFDIHAINAAHPGQSDADEAADNEKIVKIKRFHIKPMTEDEAILQMELLDHDFFVFLSAETNSFEVLYRRKDGRYGLIQPEID